MGSFKSDGMAILTIFIGAIIAVTFLSLISDDVFAQRNTIDVTNVTVTLDGTTNVTVDLEGRQLITLFEVYNSTNHNDSCAAFCTIATSVSRNTGLLSVTITTNSTTFQASDVNVSYSANPDGYLSEGTSRNVIGLVVLFGSLAILVFVIVVLVGQGSLGRFMRGGIRE